MRLTDDVLSWYDAHRQESYDLLTEIADKTAPYGTKMNIRDGTAVITPD